MDSNKEFLKSYNEIRNKCKYMAFFESQVLSKYGIEVFIRADGFKSFIIDKKLNGLYKWNIKEKEVIFNLKSFLTLKRMIPVLDRYLKEAQDNSYDKKEDVISALKILKPAFDDVVKDITLCEEDYSLIEKMDKPDLNYIATAMNRALKENTLQTVGDFCKFHLTNAGYKF